MIDLSGVVGSSCGEERGHAGLASPSRLFRGAEPGTRQAAAGARVPGGARVRAEAIGPCLRWAPRASRPAPGAPAWPLPPWPCCLREGSLLCALGSTRNVGGAPCAALPSPQRSHSSWARTAEWGAFGSSELQEDGDCVGAPVPDTPGWRPEWTVLFAAGCSPD